MCLDTKKMSKSSEKLSENSNNFWYTTGLGLAILVRSPGIKEFLGAFGTVVGKEVGKHFIHNGLSFRKQCYSPSYSWAQGAYRPGTIVLISFGLPTCVMLILGYQLYLQNKHESVKYPTMHLVSESDYQKLQRKEMNLSRAYQSYLVRTHDMKFALEQKQSLQKQAMQSLFNEFNAANHIIDNSHKPSVSSPQVKNTSSQTESIETMFSDMRKQSAKRRGMRNLQARAPRHSAGS